MRGSCINDIFLPEAHLLAPQPAPHLYMPALKVPEYHNHSGSSLGSRLGSSLSPWLLLADLFSEVRFWQNLVLASIFGYFRARIVGR